ncbi:MAG: amidohydrolase family protein [Novosphingobium sp.]|nr:amidohydrolase family protein [Novosphingobium sp.]
MVILANAAVFDGSRRLEGRYDVAIQDKHIRAISPAGIGGDAHGDSVVHLDGLTLMPGLIHSHMHADLFKYTAQDLASGQILGKERPPGVMMAIALRTCRVLLESGYTGFVGAACSNNIDAQLKAAIEEGIWAGPRIRPCGHHIGTTGDNNDIARWWHTATEPGTDVFGDGPHELQKIVRREIRSGVEIIKIYSSAGHGIADRVGMRNMSRAEIAAVVEAAHGRGALVRAHACTKDLILEAIELGIDVIDHGDEIDEECIDRMQAAGTFWVPSLAYIDKALRGWGQSDPSLHKANDQVRRMLPIAHAAGIRILLGDDYGGDEELGHYVGRYAREIALYSGIEGIEAAHVLAWGTRNAGELLVDSPERVGIVAPGALADLIVVDGDPARDASLLCDPASSLKAVMRDGNVVLNRLLDEQKA